MRRKDPQLEIAMQAKGGDPEAFVQLLELNSGATAIVLRRVRIPDQTIDDLHGEIVQAMAASLRSWKPGGMHVGNLYKLVLQRRMISLLRKVTQFARGAGVPEFVPLEEDRWAAGVDMDLEVLRASPLDLLPDDDRIERLLVALGAGDILTDQDT